MRAAAEVEPFALLVDLEVLALGNRIDQLDLEVLAALPEEVLGLLAAPEFLRERRVLLHDLVHPLLDLGEIVGMERVLLGEVVIEAVLDHGADRDLRLRPQRLHRLRHDVRGVVPDELERFRVRAGDEFDLGVSGDRVGEVGKLAVEAHGHRALSQRGRDRLGDLEPRGPRFDRAARAVGKRQRNVGHRSLLSLAAYQCSVSWSGYMLRRALEVKSGRAASGRSARGQTCDARRGCRAPGRGRACPKDGNATIARG